jgi:hypothetical protein
MIAACERMQIGVRDKLSALILHIGPFAFSFIQHPGSCILHLLKSGILGAMPKPLTTAWPDGNA